MTRTDFGVRRDQLEVGVEREYALYATGGGRLAYLLANQRLLATLHAHVAGDPDRRRRWRRMEAEGWRIAPEYSHCLIEIVSPPFPRRGWPELLAGFARLEAWLAQAAALLEARSEFERVACTADYCVRTDRFVTWQGEPVTRLDELLIDPTVGNWLLGPADQVPACLAGSAAELAYAGFTSTHVTVHPPVPGPADRDLAALAAPLAGYFWRVLHAACHIERSTRHDHPVLHDGRRPVAPDPERSIRDALIRWGDPGTAALLDSLAAPLAPEEAEARFVELFAQPPGSSFDATGLRGYSCRPRVVDNAMLFELRCFHPGRPLAELAPLLDAAAALPPG